MAHAVAYLRVSTESQAASGLGLDAQRAAIDAAASRLGLTVAAWHADEGVSGGASLDARPGLLSALDALKRGSVLLVSKRDRLGRDVLGLALIEKLVTRKGARITSAAGEGTDSDSPSDVLYRQILDAFSQFERSIIGARTKSALAAKRARGFRAGTVPFGFVADADGRLTESPAEQRVLSVLRELHAAGYTQRAIADELNRQGFTTRKGGPWRHQYVASLAVAA